jgi:hypothetical protein
MRIDISAYKSQDHLMKLEAALLGAKDYYSQRNPVHTAKSIGASGSMFRVFRGIERPSVIYQKWAFDTIRSKEFEREVLSVKTQAQFEKLHLRVGRSLSRHWKNETGQDLKLTYEYKLLDVFVKRACELELPHPKMNDNLLSYGHVPLDSSVFNALDDLFSGIFLLRGRTMGVLKTEQPYRFYQEMIRELMAELGSPALYFEYYAWNLGRALRV